MKKILSAALIAALSVPASTTLSTASADDTGRVVAGAAGGFLGGLFLGSVLSHPRPAPRPTYYVAAPDDAAPGPVCYGMASMEFGVDRVSGCATSRVGQWVTSPAIRLPLPKRKNAPPYIRAGRL